MELSFDQLEEGEIRDDDFEDISDNSDSLDSLVDLTRGKFDSTNESLRALSLSSVSADDDTEGVTRKTRYYNMHHHHHVHDHHKKLRHHHHRHHRKKRVCPLKRASHSSSSSDEDSDLDDELKIKLKEAVRIERSQERNSLHTRLLKLMQKELESEPDPESKEQEPEQNKEPVQPEPLAQIRDNLQTTQEIINSDKIDDSDLEALRLEALKTAMLNKHQIRKRKKLEALKAAETLPDKENEPEQPISAQEPDEDLDALRANLLANLKKKDPSPKKPAVDVAAIPLPAPKIPKVTKVVKQFKTQVIVNSTTKKINKVRPLPMPCHVAPLIISLGDDSDSDEPQTKTSPTAPANPQVDMSRIEKLLAESRAEAEAMQKAEAVTEAMQLTEAIQQAGAVLQAKAETTVVKATPPQKRLLQLSLAKAPKSAMKLLPKSRQIEYQQLLRQLKSAEERKKRKLVKVKAQIARTIGPPAPAPPQPVVALVEPQVVVPKEIVKEPEEGISAVCAETNGGGTEAIITDNDESAGSGSKSPVDKAAAEDEATLKKTDFLVEQVIEDQNKKSGVLKDVAILHGLLKEIRIHRNGRLQMRGKYQVLTPVVQKIMDVNNERKKHEARIKDLVKGLLELRGQLANTHEKFSTLVGELVDRKRTVDINKVKAASQSKNVVTPLKKKPEEPPATSTPTVQITPSAINNQVEDMDVCNSEDNSDMCHHIDIMDPNDIDQIFPRKQQQIQSNLNFPDYVSPLNTCGRYNFVDPQGVLCPFELAGFCRDTECTFKHYLMR